MKSTTTSKKEPQMISSIEDKETVQRKVMVGYTAGRLPSGESPECNWTDDQCYCYIDGKNYYVKASRVGVNSGLFNPFDVSNLKRPSTPIGQPKWEFIKVSKDVFELYQAFLQTRNKTMMLKANREFRNH